MHFRFFVILFFAILYNISAKDKSRDEACTTPKGDTGKCVPLNQCQEVYNAITSSDKEILNFVLLSYCGVDEETLVCCKQPGPVPQTDFDVSTELGNEDCGIVKESPKIIGGIVADIGEFPWLVAIELKKRGTNESVGVRCAGSLINNEFVLTAAQCILNREFEATAVRLGEWDLITDPDCKNLVANEYCADPIQIVVIKQIIPHALFVKRTSANDVGLIQLEKKVAFTEFIRPICLANPKLPPLEANAFLEAAGWGLTENDTTSDVLLKVSLPLVSKDVCKEKFTTKSITSHHICAGGSGKDTCYGDAGTPLMKIYEDKQEEKVLWYQYGITSFGFGCGRPGYPAAYLKVSDYVDWIINVIKEYKQK